MEAPGLRVSDPLSTIEHQDAQFFRRLLDQLNDAIYFVDRDRCISYGNEGAAKITGFPAGEAVGRYCFVDFLCHTDRAGEKLCNSKCPLKATIEDGEYREVFVFLRHKAGHRVPVRVRVAPMVDGTKVVGAVETFSDDSDRESAKHRVQQLEELAFLDSLTGVSNRRYLEIRLQSALQEFVLSNERVGLLSIDVDEFKQINDRHGHEIGDQTRVMIARTLKGVLRADDLLGRWGGDEFVAIIQHASHETLKLVGERCRTLVRETRISHESGEFSPTISVGGVMITSDDTMTSLLKRVDQMMYLSKTAGRDRTTVQ